MPAFSRHDEVLCEAIARGVSVTKAAALAGLSRRTAHRRLAGKEFRERVSEIRRALRDRNVGQFIAVGAGLGKVLRGLLRSKSEAIRLGALRAAVELGIRVTESVEMAAEIEAIKLALEEKIGGLDE